VNYNTEEDFDVHPIAAMVWHQRGLGQGLIVKLHFEEKENFDVTKVGLNSLSKWLAERKI
jgi:hypothetical protein